jgi:hypothetical protein
MAVLGNDIKVQLSKTTNVLLSVAGVVGAITIIAGGYTWYMNNLWRPKIVIDSVDFNNGIAKLKHRNKDIELNGDSTYWLNADWGVRFGSIKKANQNIYNRLELVNKGMVVEYIKKDI